MLGKERPFLTAWGVKVASQNYYKGHCQSHSFLKPSYRTLLDTTYSLGYIHSRKCTKYLLAQTVPGTVLVVRDTRVNKADGVSALIKRTV